MKTALALIISTITLLVAEFAAAQTTYQAHSQYGNGIVNSSGQWANQIGSAGAQANRNAANQLFQQSLQHESEGLATLNPGLLSQALTESQQGIQADDQARHLAQTSLQALQSGQAAGHVDLTNNYGTTESQLQDLANNSSPLLPTVQSHLSGWGIQVNHNANVIETPFGQFPLNAGPGDITSAASKVAQALGYSADSVSGGVQAAIANAQSIGKKAYAEASANAGAPKGGDATGVNGKGSELAALKPLKQAATAAAKITPMVEGKDPALEYDMAANAAALAKSRAAMKAKFSLKENANEVAEKSQNLFLLVHEQYQDMQRRGSFDKTQQVASIPSSP